MTLKEEKQFQTQLRRHIIRTIDLNRKAFENFLVESGRTIFTNGTLLCVYNYVLPVSQADGYYKVTKKGEFVFESAERPGIGLLHMWDTVIPEESVYTDETVLDLTAYPDRGISRLLARLGSKGLVLNFRYLLDLPRGKYAIKYLPRGENDGYTPVTLRRSICEDIEFKAVMMPLPPI